MTEKLSLEASIATALASPEGAKAALIELSRLDCEESLAEFTRQAWHVIEPGTVLKWNWHLDVLCAYIQFFFSGKIKRLILNVPPGSLKSVLFAVMGPAWKWAHSPEERIISLTNEIGLATRDNRRMRQIIESDWYQARWGDKVGLAKDQNEKTLFANSANGFRQGLGITGNVTGKRGSYLLLDDPLDAQKAFSDIAASEVNATYDNAVSSRLNDPVEDSIGLIMQRLRTNDLTGHLMTKKATNWVQVRIPMEYEGQPGYDPVKDLGEDYAHLIDPRTQVGELMFPERFPRYVVDALKEDLGEYGTAGQLQQRPSPLSGGIIKTAWWKQWPADKPMPTPIHVFSSMDTAFTERDYKDAAYSARTTWMIFEDDSWRGEKRHALMMLGSWWGRVGYPELRKNTREHVAKTQGLDRLLIEKKASGISLIQDLRRMRKLGVSVRGFDPKRMDKVTRAQVASPMFEAGLVYYPDREWAKQVIAHVADFPTGAPPSADLTDTVTQAVIYTKQRMWAQPPDDDEIILPDEQHSEEFDEDHNEPKRAAYG